MWGTATGSEPNTFFDAGTCIVGTTATKCHLGAPGSPAEITPPELCTLFLKDAGPECSVHLKGCTPGIRNTGVAGEGFVKAWARINADGTVASCYKCNSGATLQLGTGQYAVDFSPLSSDITGRPRSATLDTLSSGTTVGEIGVANLAGSPPGIFVSTWDSSGISSNRSFVLVIY